jgi:predicted Fe-Mo cluster-binding NifX family protein
MLNDTEKAVIETMVMKLLPQAALQYLHDAGVNISHATFFRVRKRIEEMKNKRLEYIAQHFGELHMEKIDRLDLIEKMM